MTVDPLRVRICWASNEGRALHQTYWSSFTRGCFTAHNPVQNEITKELKHLHPLQLGPSGPSGIWHGMLYHLS